MAKLITYLDEYKMYSISSQIFEGLTQDVVQYSERKEERSEQQKGPLNSGRLLADILSDTKGRAERRFLFDYAYTIFEQRLVDDGYVLSIDDESQASQLADLGSRSFLRITGRLKLNDLATVQRTTKDFNRTMEALQYVSGSEMRNALTTLLQLELESADGKRKYEISKQLKELAAPKAKPAMDAKFIEHLVYLIEFGFGDHLEAQLSLQAQGTESPTLFTAILDRGALREDAAVLVKKYSRQSEQPFTVFGIVTQRTRVGDWNAPKKDARGPEVESAEVMTQQGSADEQKQQQKHLKVALTDMTDQIGNIEDSFFGRLANEVIIDPIAIYRQL